MMLSNEQKDSIITSLERIAADLDFITLFCDWIQNNGAEAYKLVDAVQKIADALTTDKK